MGEQNEMVEEHSVFVFFWDEMLVVSKEVKSGLMMLEQDWFFHFFYVDVHETRSKVTMLESYVLHSQEQGMGQENY